MTNWHLLHGYTEQQPLLQNQQNRDPIGDQYEKCEMVIGGPMEWMKVPLPREIA